MEQNITPSSKKALLSWIGFIFAIISFLATAPIWEDLLEESFGTSPVDAIIDILGIQGTLIYSFFAEINPLLIFIPGVISIILASISLHKKIGKKAVSVISLVFSIVSITTIIILIVAFLLDDEFYSF